MLSQQRRPLVYLGLPPPGDHHAECDANYHDAEYDVDTGVEPIDLEHKTFLQTSQSLVTDYTCTISIKR